MRVDPLLINVQFKQTDQGYIDVRMSTGARVLHSRFPLYEPIDHIVYTLKLELAKAGIEVESYLFTSIVSQSYEKFQVSQLQQESYVSRNIKGTRDPSTERLYQMIRREEALNKKLADHCERLQDDLDALVHKLMELGLDV